MKKAIYTAIIGGYDGFVEPRYVNEGFDYFLFTDNENIKSDVYKIIKVEKPRTLDSVRFARQIKILPHKFLPEYDLTIWHDGNITQCKDIRRIVVNMSFDFLFMKHPSRDCIYTEAKAVIDMELDSKDIVNKQIARYRNDKFPENQGMCATGIMFRKKTKEGIALCEDWWKELLDGSRRDQLSFNYVKWKHDFSINLVAFGGGDGLLNNEFRRAKHKRSRLFPEKRVIRRTSNTKIAIYTVNVNDYDNYNDIDFSQDGVEFHYFTDKKERVKGFRMSYLDYKRYHEDSGKASRRIKCTAHKFFNCEYSIYVDASFKIRDVDFQGIIEDLGDFDIAQFRHPERNCIYKEAETCLSMPKFNSESPFITKKVLEYSKNKFPTSYGLACGGFIIRKHSKKMTKFNEMWWNEIKTGTTRDQISEMYCIWKTGIKLKYIEGDIYNNHIVKFNNEREYRAVSSSLKSAQ